MAPDEHGYPYLSSNRCTDLYGFGERIGTRPHGQPTPHHPSRKPALRRSTNAHISKGRLATWEGSIGGLAGAGLTSAPP